MACTLINVKPTENCLENYSGTGNKAYIARLTDAERESLTYDPAHPYIYFGGAVTSTFAEVVLKSKVNKVDYQSNPNGGGYTATANLVVDKQVDSWAVNSRIMNNTSDWIVLLSTGKKDEYYFLGSPVFDNEFSDAATTGDAPDSDKGSTITVTAGPLQWEYLKIEGKINLETGAFTQAGTHNSGEAVGE